MYRILAAALAAAALLVNAAAARADAFADIIKNGTLRVAVPLTRPTPAMRPSRTPTAPVIDGPPEPSMMRAFVIRRSNGRADC